MVTVVDESSQLRVPNWVVDLDSFRRWVDEDDFPQKVRVWYLKGEVWVDMSKEQLFSHLAVKNEIARVLTGLVKAGQLGLFFPDSLFLSNPQADIAGNPDGTFSSNETLQSGRVRLIEGERGGYVEMQGSPDMVLEVVSNSSTHKDRVTMRQAYWECEIKEYWLVDARKELEFDILRRTARGYVATRKHGGWLKSAVFGKSFRLREGINALGHREFTL